MCAALLEFDNPQGCFLIFQSGFNGLILDLAGCNFLSKTRTIFLSAREFEATSEVGYFYWFGMFIISLKNYFVWIFAESHGIETKDNHSSDLCPLPWIVSVNDFWIFFVIRPTCPSPIFRKSISITGITSAAVPQMNISSAI